MKKNLLFFMVTFLMLPSVVRGFEFEGLDYTILDEALKTCEVSSFAASAGTIAQGIDIYLPEQAVDSSTGQAYTLTSIGGYMFHKMESVASVFIPKTVTSISAHAFYDCSALVVVDSWNPNYSSEDGALFNKDMTTLICYPTCEGLSEYDIPSSVTTIAYGAFAGCDNLQYLSIPDGVKAIEAAAFTDCTNLVEVDLPNSVTSLGAYAFYNCTSLKSVSLSSSLTVIETGTFWDCSSLESLVIPEGVKEIEEYAVLGCTGLSSITIPSTIESFGSEVWFGCTGLRSVYYAAENPVAAARDIFPDEVYTSANFYSPAAGSENANVAPWNSFSTTETYTPEVNNTSGVKDVDAITDNHVEVYNLGGVKVADSLDHLPAGLYIVRQGTTVSKIAVE
jgi:hypothetical protein